MGVIPNEYILAKAHLENIDHPYSYETSRVLGTIEYYKALKENDPDSAKKLPARLKIMMGIYEHRENGEENGESSNMFDKSRYAFFLDAPFEISNQCCNVMKKNPVHEYDRETGKVPITGQMASESRLRTQKWLEYGCNMFQAGRKKSNPMSFWTEQDVLHYIKENNLTICSVYGDIVRDEEVDGQITMADMGITEDTARLKTTGCDRTGCMFCGFGCHLEKGQGRFERMKTTHPMQYEYIMKPWSEGGLGYKDVIDWINENGNLHIRY